MERVIVGAVWMLRMLVETYFLSFLKPFSDFFPLSLIGAVGTLALTVGVVACVRTGWRPLRLFALPVAFSVALIMLSSALWEQVRTDATINIITAVFLGGQLLAALFLVWLLRRAWLAAVPLAIFSMTFAVFAMFIAAMALTGNWL
jgi:hypothetical protein